MSFRYIVYKGNMCVCVCCMHVWHMCCRSTHGLITATKGFALTLVKYATAPQVGAS